MRNLLRELRDLRDEVAALRAEVAALRASQPVIVPYIQLQPYTVTTTIDGLASPKIEPSTPIVQASPDPCSNMFVLCIDQPSLIINGG